MSSLAAPDSLHGSVTASCQNCGSPTVESWCASCGERQLSHRDLSLGGLIRAGVQEFLGIDGKIARTIWALISKPGLLTAEFIRGRRGIYSRPFALFVTLNLLFFLIQPYTQLLRFSVHDYTTGAGRFEVLAREMIQRRTVEKRETPDAYKLEFERNLSDQKKSMLLFSIPILAVLMAVLFAGSSRYFVEHLVFSVHAYAFFLVVLVVGLYLTLYAVAGWIMIVQLAGAPIGALSRVLTSEPGVLTVHTAIMATYLGLALRRAYGLAGRWAIPGGIVLALAQMFLVLGFRIVLFYTTWFVT
jgi:hypothetical protein